MYAASQDPYCIPGTTILKNLAELDDQEQLDQLELLYTTQRLLEPLPIGSFTVAHYKTVHRHIFQDIYGWAGEFRMVRISKGQSSFCYPEHIESEMQKLFAGLDVKRWPQIGLSKAAAHFLAELNAIHPFRDGNGRTQLAFMGMMAMAAGHPLRLDRIEPAPFLAAMIASFRGDEAPLVAQIERLIDGPFA